MDRDAEEEEAREARERARGGLERLRRGRAEAREADGLSPERPPDPPPDLAERIDAHLAARPERAALFLILVPFVWPVLVLARALSGPELRHESWSFRYHDFVARHPILGLSLSLIGALGSVFGSMAAAYLIWQLRRYYFR
ncbi:MAG: hypothetical protein AB7N76_15005 [Planctomycetota bacterium]